MTDAAASATRRAALALFAVALAVRLVALLVALAQSAPLSVDSQDYAACASAVLHGDSWPSPWRPAGWPLVLAWLLAIGGEHSYLPAQLFGVLLSALVAPLSFHLAAGMLPARRAVLAGLIVALHPSLLFLSTALLSEPLTWLLLALLATRWTNRGADGSSLISGLLVGTLATVRAAMVVLLPVALLLPWRSSRLRHAGLAALGFALAVAGILGVVRWRTGFVGSAPGAFEHMLWMGASPERLVPEAQIRSPLRDRLDLDDAEKAREFRRLALADLASLARRRPVEIVLHPLRKLFALHELTSSGRNRALAFVTQAPLSLFALLGASALVRRGSAEARHRAWILLGIAAAVALPPLVTMPWTRYYSPLIPLLAPLVAAVGWRKHPDAPAITSASA